MSTVEKISVEFDRYRDGEGNPTCAIDFNTGTVCQFFRTQRLGCHETCALSPAIGSKGLYVRLERRNVNGFLIPGDWCPLWKD